MGCTRLIPPRSSARVLSCTHASKPPAWSGARDRYKNIIEEEMIENDNRNTENKGVDVNIIVHFQNKFVEF